MTDESEKDEPNAAAPTDIPEVDAEIVEENDAIADAPFDDAPPVKDAHAKRSFISPGVLFFAGMVLVAIGAGALWYFTTGIHEIRAGKETKPAIETSQPIEPEAQEETPDAKLENDEVADAKPASQAAPGAGDEPLTFPPQSDTIENTELQIAAKEAAGLTDNTEPTANADENMAPAPQEPVDATVNAEMATPENNQGILEPDEILQTDEIENANDATGWEQLPADVDPSPELQPRDQITDAATADEPPISDGAAQRIATLEATISTLQSELAATNNELAVATSALDDARFEIDTLRSENAALKNAARRAPAIAGAVALNKIITAIESGQSFTTELSVIEETVNAPAPIETLRPFAAKGAPSMASIRDEFAAAARAGLSTANRVNAGGVVERYGARVAGLFNVRPATPQAGDSAGAIISRAEYAVEQADLAAAIAEIETLPPPAQEAMSDWMVRARQRAQIDASLQALSAAYNEQAAAQESL